jgi:4-cresol dehydrogenase (hydroxylating)
VLQTGYGHYPTARTASLFKSGLGPFLDGIFTQSNFGVVTRATIWLQRESPYLGVALVQINSDKSIAKAFNRIRNLKLEGRLKGPVRFANNNRMLSCFTQRPVSDAQSPEQLNQSLQRLCKKWGVKCWNGVIGLQGERSEVRLQVKTLKRELGPLASIQFCSNRMLNLALRFESLYKLFTGCDLKQKSALFNLLKGQPTIGPTLGAYWRKSFAPEARDFDPPRDGCGLIWCCPIIPLGEYDVLQLLSTTRATCAKHGLETNLALLPIDERSACCTVGLIYNRDNSEEQTAALECHDALLSRYMKHGYIPYRFGAHISESAAGLFDPNDTYWQVCNSIKEALDPAGILSPGRYGLGKAANSEHA